MKGSVTARTGVALAALLGTLVGGCRSMEQTIDQVSIRTEQSVNYVTTRIEKTEREVVNRLSGR